VVEVRLDYFEEPYNVAELVRRSPRPLIATNRPPREGGRATLSESDRVRSLLDAADAGAPLVDVEWDSATPQVVADLRAAGASVIVSRHAFDRMPADLARWAADVAATTTDIVKVVGMARDATDVPTVLDVLATSYRPTIAIAMGAAGAASRILALRYDACYLTFAAPPDTSGTAPGQLSIDDLQRIYRVNQIGSRTSFYGVLGATPSDELLVQLNDSLRARGLDAVAVALPDRPMTAAIVQSFAKVPVEGWLLAGLLPIDQLVPVVRRFGSRARQTGLATAIACRGRELFADNVAQRVEPVLEFWLGGTSSVGEDTGRAKLQFD
jgi:3-dehydroquinate dehydratase type I